MEIRKEDLIRYGLKVFEDTGANEICRVCIRSGNSCCKGCEFLKDQEGCQQRNTSCMAWLCGLQKHFFRKIGLLEEWEKLWTKIPGKIYRGDLTPDIVEVTRLLDMRNIRKESGKLMAEEFHYFIEDGGDLERLEQQFHHQFVMEKI